MTDEFLSLVALGLACSVTAFMVHGFFDTNFYSTRLTNLPWIGMGIVSAVLHLFVTPDLSCPAKDVGCAGQAAGNKKCFAIWILRTLRFVDKQPRLSIMKSQKFLGAVSVVAGE